MGLEVVLFENIQWDLVYPRFTNLFASTAEHQSLAMVTEIECFIVDSLSR